MKKLSSSHSASGVNGSRASAAAAASVRAATKTRSLSRSRRSSECAPGRTLAGHCAATARANSARWSEPRTWLRNGASGSAGNGVSALGAVSACSIPYPRSKRAVLGGRRLDNPALRAVAGKFEPIAKMIIVRGVASGIEGNATGIPIRVALTAASGPTDDQVCHGDIVVRVWRRDANHAANHVDHGPVDLTSCYLAIFFFLPFLGTTDERRHPR